MPTPRQLRLTGGAVALNTRRDGALLVRGLELLGELTPPPGYRGSPSSSADGPDRSYGSHTTYPRTPHQPLVELQLHGATHTSDEAYTLTLSAHDPPASITAQHPRGLRHGLCTLSQLLAGAQSGAQPVALPALEISDSPAFPTRAVMLDISRNRVPTMATLRDIIDTLASLKINHLQLYTEHTFAYRGHEQVWRDASPITPDEARELDAYCAARGIELVPNQNCFGHLAPWLKHEPYQHLAETTGDWTFLQWPRSGGFSLCPTDPRSVEFVDNLLAQLLPCFRSNLVNIGCDETYDVGQGRSAQAVAERGKAAVYFDFVNRVADRVRARGARPMVWADIALEHADKLHRFPEGAIGLAWGYEPDAPFAQWCRTLADAGIERWVCPGTSSWRSITGRTPERRENIARAAREGAAAGATGLLLTDWGDCGHLQQWPVSLNAIAHGAAAAWNPETDPESPNHQRAVSSLVFGADGVAEWLDAIGTADYTLRRLAGQRNGTLLFCELFRPQGSVLGFGSADEWRAVRAEVEALAASIPRAGDSTLRHEVAHTASLAMLCADAALHERGDQTGERTSDALARRTRLRQREHERIWRVRSRDGGLAESTSWFDRAAERLKD